VADSVWSRVAGAMRYVFARGEDPRRMVHYYPIPVQAAGVVLTTEVSQQVSVVWACVDTITKAIASSQWRVFERRGRQRIMLPDDPLTYLLNTRPNPEMTAIAFRECLLYQALLIGNGYAEIIRDGSGRVAQLWPLMTDRVCMRRSQETGDIFYEYYNFNGPTVAYRPDQIYHLRGPSPSGWLGDNMVARAAKSIALHLAQERFSSAYYANGASAGIVLKNARPLDDKAYEKMKNRWNDEHLGPDKASRVAVLDGGWDVDSLSNKPADSELLASRKYQLEEICRFFGVPPHRVQDLSRATYNNIEHLGLEFVRDALTPWCERMEQEADFKLFPQRAPWRSTNIDIDWLAHGDAQARSSFYEKMRNIGVFSANDILEKENMNTLGEEGNLRVLMSNYTTYEGVQAMVDQTNAENETLRQGLPDPTAPLKDPPDNGGLGGGVQVSRRLRSGAVLSLVASPLPRAPDTDSPMRAREALFGAVLTLVSGSLERYSKRLQNRAADLHRGKKSQSQINTMLADERSKIRPKLIEELLEVFTPALLKQCAYSPSEQDFVSAADSVDNGMDPVSVAASLVRRALDGEHVQGHPPDVPSGQ